MFVLKKVALIRRPHFVQGQSIDVICRELRVLRKVVRKVLQSAATDFATSVSSNLILGLVRGGRGWVSRSCPRGQGQP